MKQKLEAAIRRRCRWGFGGNEAFRVADGRGDQMDGIFVDCYAGHWVVATREVEIPPEILEVANAEEGCRSVWWKRLEVDQKEPPQWMAGESGNGEIAIQENSLSFEIHLKSGYSQGIFIDQRKNRKGCQRRSGGAENPVLNLFAYTCGFSVAAAAAGAETVSVDLSRNYLDWGRRNFELNGIDPAGHGFLRDDALAVLRRFGNRGRTFSGVVVDPPTFSRNDRGKVFRVESDFGDLVEMAARVIEPGGWLFCSSNTRKLGEDAFRRMVELGLSEAGRRGKITPGRMPEDFTGERYLKSVWVVL